MERVPTVQECDNWNGDVTADRLFQTNLSSNDMHFLSRDEFLDRTTSIYELILLSLFETRVDDAKPEFPLHYRAVQHWNHQHRHDLDRHATKTRNGHGHHDVRPSTS